MPVNPLQTDNSGDEELIMLFGKPPQMPERLVPAFDV